MAGVAGALVSANGQGVYTAASAGVNAAENNWLSQKRPSLLGLSDQERYAAASAACGKGDETACGTMRQLAQVSAGKDTALQDACATGANSPGCVAQVQIAQAAGNKVFVDDKGNITINGVMFATAGPIVSPFTTSTAGQMAQSTADGLILEVGNQAAGLAAGAAVRFFSRASSDCTCSNFDGRSGDDGGGRKWNFLRRPLCTRERQ